MLFKKKSYSSANKFKIKNNPKRKVKKKYCIIVLCGFSCTFYQKFFCRAFWHSHPVPMYPNLKVGDYLFVSKILLWFFKALLYPSACQLFQIEFFYDEPQRGDIVVFKTPEDNRTDYIKRLIGLPGDKIEIVNNVISINGKEIKYDKISDAKYKYFEVDLIKENIR